MAVGAQAAPRDGPAGGLSMEWLDNFWQIYSNLVLTIGINALLALSIYLTLSCGMLAMANAAFMGIGAYTASILTMTTPTSLRSCPPWGRRPSLGTARRES